MSYKSILAELELAKLPPVLLLMIESHLRIYADDDLKIINKGAITELSYKTAFKCSNHTTTIPGYGVTFVGKEVGQYSTITITMTEEKFDTEEVTNASSKKQPEKAATQEAPQQKVASKLAAVAACAAGAVAVGAAGFFLWKKFTK
jgi:hypothetical protein